LLNNKNFSPIDLILEKEKRAVVITGPNTGGKTVALKTLGLLSLIFQTGIPVPVDEESETTIFENIFVDIGDYQSIEQNLSTYSWHISNIKEILENTNDKSLVLLDELIPGTDPDEGSSIGIGILKFLKDKKSYTVATSHFKQIKLFALSDDYFKVASVGFDKEKLSPTYKLTYNSVGQSMAFYIAEKIGINKQILETAKEYLKKEDLSLNKALEELENLKNLYEKENEKYKKLVKELEEEKLKYKKLNEELEKLKKEKWKESITEIKEFVKSIKKEGYSILEEIKTSGSGKEIEEFNKKVMSKINSLKEEREETSDEFEIGDKVKLKGKNTIGEIISVRENRVNVNFNGIKIWVDINELEKIYEKNEKPKTKFHIKKTKTNIKNEINLIGLTKEDAIKKLSDYLDNAVLEGYSQIRIIHGYGAGVLRKAVREYLDTCPYKIKYKDASYSEGGMGVTIAEIL
jgi:DNA mismatch repair protein MutS2